MGKVQLSSPASSFTIILLSLHHKGLPLSHPDGQEATLLHARTLGSEQRVNSRHHEQCQGHNWKPHAGQVLSSRSSWRCHLVHQWKSCLMINYSFWLWKEFNKWVSNGLQLYFVVVAWLGGMVTQYPIFSVFSNNLQNLQMNPPNCWVLSAWVFAGCKLQFHLSIYEF